MKQIILVRHAKAVQWGYDDDFERELTERGKNDTAKVSVYLRESGIIPGMMITSPALRALQTATAFAAGLGFPEERIIQDPELYHGYTSGELLQLIHSFPDEIKSVGIFGHNPSFEYYAMGLCKSFRNEIPTCSAVIIDFPVERWKDAEARTGMLFKQVNPKDLIS